MRMIYADSGTIRDVLARLDLAAHNYREHLEEVAAEAGPGDHRTSYRAEPCPTCKEPNKLTKRDRKKGYQCDACADGEEGYY